MPGGKRHLDFAALKTGHRLDDGLDDVPLQLSEQLRPRPLHLVVLPIIQHHLCAPTRRTSPCRGLGVCVCGIRARHVSFVIVQIQANFNFQSTTDVSAGPCL